ncbi:MAG: LuxR C-terminal-related transcriptional regulator [Bacteroidota bacterium]
MKTPDLLIAHSFEMYTMGLKDSLLKKGYVVKKVVNTGKETLRYIFKNHPAIVILQEELSSMSAFEIISRVREKKLKTRFIVVYNSCDERGMILSQWVKVHGSVHLGDSLIIHENCIKKVLAGEKYYSCSFFKERLDRSLLRMERLSLSERKVLKMISVYECSEKIAMNMNLSKRTIEKHRSNIITKLNLDKKTNSLLQWVLKNKPYVDSLAFRIS